jgi:hypothetical protein
MHTSRILIPLAVLLAFGMLAGQARAQFNPARGLVQVSADPFTNAGAEHATELEPDIFAYGMTAVGAFQTGRYSNGGSTDIGFATTSDGGRTWSSGFLPGISQGQNPSNPYQRVSDPAVAHDAKHAVWIINSLPVPTNPAAIVSRSFDGLNWDDPISVAPAPSGSDKNWITCDNTTTSKYYGNCYVEWDDGYGTISVNTSNDGGLTWSSTVTSQGSGGLGGQPLTLRNGTVVIPYTDAYEMVWATVSKNGGKTFSTPIAISPLANHGDATMRAPALPSATIDGGGTIYVAWADCQFRSGCSANDIVISTSTDGTHWSAKARVPIDPLTSTVDHFIPGLGADPLTAGSSAHLGLLYYFFPKSNCTTSTCKLHAGFISSKDGGATWGSSTKLTGAMNVSWLANAGGRFVGDYEALAFTSDGLAHSVFAVGVKPSGGPAYNEAMYTTASGLAVQTSGVFFTSRFEHPLPGVHTDHPRIHFPPKADRAAGVEQGDDD